MKKLIIATLILSTLLVGCGNEQYGKDEKNIITVDFSGSVIDYRDPKTGVHYLFYKEGYGGGLSVRYNADGSLMVD